MSSSDAVSTECRCSGMLANTATCRVTGQGVGAKQDSKGTLCSKLHEQQCAQVRFLGGIAYKDAIEVKQDDV